MSSDDVIPSEAVVGGHDNGEMVYVARARHARALCPGKYVPSLKQAVVGYGLRAHKKTTFEILCGINFIWVKATGNNLPQNALPGGVAPETHNELLYIGRVQSENSVIPGKVHLHYKTCYVTVDELEKEFSAYEVLVVPGNLSVESVRHPVRFDYVVDFD